MADSLSSPKGDVLSQLPLLTWRGLAPPPYTVVGFDWAHQLAPRQVPYVDVDVHEFVRRESAKFKVRLFFNEVLEAGAFTAKWPAWLVALKDGNSDLLVHPLLGPMQARVAHVGGEVKAETRDGVIVEVEFIETNDDPSQISTNLNSDFSILTNAQNADFALSAADVPYPDGTFATSIFDAISQIQGELFSFGLTVSGAISSTLSNILAVYDAVKAKNDNEQYATLDSLVTVYMQLFAMQKAIAATARTTATKLIRVDTTLEKFASQVGNSLQDIMSANVQALRFPLVPKGSTLVYYT